ncbi:MAG: hypothetical protein HY314_05025 [Acidobacteria bacterium]|nr:hypothetical protein [Acidobacteriota bacterium]
MTKDNFAVIISGVGGDPAYTKRFAEWAEAMYDLLRDQLKFAEDQIFCLIATPTEAARLNTTKATADTVRSTLARLKALAQPRSRIFIFLVGHGSFENQQAKFNLVGPDLTAEDFDQLLDALPTQNIVLVNAASASGPFINALSQPGRVIITATRSGHERNATTFAEFFIRAFKDNQADLDKSGRVSILEAFTYATKMIEQWYQQEGRLATEHALLDDNGDKIGHSGATDGDGALARMIYLDSQPLTQAAGDAELQKLMQEKERLEPSIEALKARKTEMSSAAYEAELERLLIQLAQINQKIRARQK